MNFKIILGIVFVIIFTLFIYFILYNLNSYKVLGWWNSHIDKIRNEQNKVDHLQDASLSNVKTARKLNRLISESHNQILQEVHTLMESGYYGYPMSKMDDIQRSLTQGSENWSPIWIKFIDSWAGSAKHLPTLTKIVKEIGDDIVLLHVSVFKPGTYLPYHTGISKCVWRYHYGLQIPEGDTYLEIEGVKHKWEAGRGFIWDDTLPHSAWNYTDKIRMVIFADIYRNMPSTYKQLSKLMHKGIQATSHVRHIAKNIESECEVD